MMQPFDTPTQLSIKKAGKSGYLLEVLAEVPVKIDPMTGRPIAPCAGMRTIRGLVFKDMDELLIFVREYLEKGDGCRCEDCDH